MANLTYHDKDGNKWDSRYEWEVYEAIREMGLDVRRCSPEQGDTFSYASKVIRGECLECESDNIVQRRTYTPDLFVSDLEAPNGDRGCYIEVKGYWKAPKRNLLRSVVESNPHLNLLFIFQKDLWVTRGKSRYTDYIKRYFKRCRVNVWNNQLKNPGDIIPASWLKTSS